MAGQLARRPGNGLRRSFPFPLPFGRDIDDMFNRMLSRELPWSDDEMVAPSMDIFETDQAYHASFELPGVKPEDVDIQVNGNVLTVTGETKNKTEQEGRTFHRTERAYGSFARSVTLPREVTEDKVAAKLEGGVLTIDLPKAEASKPSKIKIQGS